MAIRATHELHTRRFSRNVGVGVLLVFFVGLTYALTIAKVGTDPTDELGADWATPATESAQ